MYCTSLKEESNSLIFGHIPIQSFIFHVHMHVNTVGKKYRWKSSRTQQL